MISLEVVLLLVTMHFFADFAFQFRWLTVPHKTGPKLKVSRAFSYAMLFFIFGAQFYAGIFLSYLLVSIAMGSILDKLLDNHRFKWYYLTLGVSQMLHLQCLFLVYFIVGVDPTILNFLKGLLT